LLKGGHGSGAKRVSQINFSPNVQAYAKLGGGIIGSNATHHRLIWVNDWTKWRSEPHRLC